MDQELTKEEAERRAQAVARRMLNTPPQPRGKPKAKPARARVAKSGKRGYSWRGVLGRANPPIANRCKSRSLNNMNEMHENAVGAKFGHRNTI